MTQTTPAQTTSAGDSAPANSRGPSRGRRLGLILLAIVVVFALASAGVYWMLTARFHQSTDDAYVGGDLVTVTSREPAMVQALYADDTQAVHRGQVLVDLDPAAANANLQAAEADLARTIRAVRGAFAKSSQSSAQIAAARVRLQLAQGDYHRRAGSPSDGSVSTEEIAHARDAVSSATASLESAQSGHVLDEAAVQGTSVADNPEVLAAMARLRTAAIIVGHMKLVSPVDGVVAQRTVQLGQQIAPGAPLMAVVPLDNLWVDANFKENQLASMRVGQPASITADVYGGAVTYHGRVEGLSAGSGSVFSVLPPQNATGNWIKIVQRVPVRIALNPKELRAHPLRVGLSVKVRVDIRDRSGPPIGAAASLGPPRVWDNDVGDPLADRLIAEILARNEGAKRR
ncbi:MAG: efflux RND transporter periplasmic adaptor subunit [Caulobacteraceae bacterium]